MELTQNYLDKDTFSTKAARDHAMIAVGSVPMLSFCHMLPPSMKHPVATRCPARIGETGQKLRMPRGKLSLHGECTWVQCQTV